MAEILGELRCDADRSHEPEWVVGIDSGIVRAHQHTP
jgi:hypothetical protein